jgi:16S rRNA (uracil1498-N3)-methyltransferase
MRRFPCGRVPEPGERLVLDPATSHHVTTVTKVPRGSRLVVFDGHGNAAEGRLVEVNDGLAVVEVDLLLADATPRSPLVACLAVTKGSRFETAVRMAVELGATEVRPVLAKRCVAKGDRHDRWERVVEGAVGQSGQNHVPWIAPLRSLREVVEPSGWDPGVMRWICVPGAPAVAGTTGPAAVLVGPEGGWTDAEVQLALDAGWQPAGLGDTVLRAETAVAAALTRIRCAGPARD